MKIKHRRHLRNFLLYPHLQLRYAWMYFGLISFPALTMIALNQWAFSKIELLIEAPEKLEILKHWSSNFLLLQVILFALSTLCIYFFTIVITHRFVGPMKSIIKHFENLKEDAPSALLHQRQDDSLGPLVDYINSHQIRVDSKKNEKNPATKETAWLKNRKGMTVAEVLVGLFIISVTLIGFAGSMSVFTSDLKKTQAQSTKSDLSSYIRMNSRDYAAFYNSAQMPENKELAECLSGSSLKGCTNREEVPFVFYSKVKPIPSLDSSGNPIKDSTGKDVYLPELLGGVGDLTCPKKSTSKGPAFYTADGRLCQCDSRPATCPLQIVTSYVAYCANDENTCAFPASLKMKYSIKMRPNLPKDFKLNLATSEGFFFAPINDELQYFLKFNYASSFNINPDTGAQIINSAVSAYDIRQGKTLSYSNPAALHIYAHFSAPEEISSLTLLRYAYPSGCNMSNLGQTITNESGTPVNCAPPSPDKFSAVNTQNTFTPAKTLSISLTDTVVTSSVVEYKLSVFNAAGVKVMDSKYNLRAYYQEESSVSVTAPTQLVYNCVPDSTSNVFTFTANSFSSWKQVKATVSPAQNNGSSELNGFDKFNPHNPNPQKITVDPSDFTPGVTYTVTITGVTEDNAVKTDSKSFTVKPKPDKKLTITKPSNGSMVRTAADLELSADVNLGCEQNPKLMTFKILKDSDKSVVMPDLDVTSSCTPAEGAVDENKFKCTLSVPCKTWLATTASCTSVFSVDTFLNALSTVTDTSGSKINQSNIPVFKAGAKLSVNIQREFTQFVLFDSSIVANPESSLDIKVDFSSDLLPGEKVDLSLTGSTNKVDYTCAATGSVNATLNKKTCALRLPWPVNKGDIFTLSAKDPDVVHVNNPSTVAIQFYDATTLSCQSMVGGPVCPSGTTLRAQYIKQGTYGSNDWENKGVQNTAVTKLINSTSEMDFFLYYVPLNSTTPGMNVDISFGMGSVGNTVSDVYTTHLGPLNPPPACNMDMTSCPANVAYVPTSVFASRKSMLLGVSSFDMIFSRDPATTGSIWGTRNSKRGIMLVRQCYCQ